MLTTKPNEITQGDTHLIINFKYCLTLSGLLELIRSSSNLRGTIHPNNKDNSNPPNINKIPPKIASIFPKIFKSIAAGIPVKKIRTVATQTAFFLFQPNLSIKEETGTSRREIEDVIAAI